jgi:ribosome maturation protein Sdo1
MAHTSISDLTIDDLRKLIRETVIQTLFEILSDPDEGLELKDEFKLELQRALATDEVGQTIPAQDVANRLGLTW